MKIKEIPKDFIVEEIINLDNLKNKNENKKDYFYFLLKKTNYSQMRAIEKIAKILNTSRKVINFAGTKDKVGITSQVISIYNLKEENLQKNINFLNSDIPDLELKFLGKFKGRINLGDNEGNKFKITVRDLEEKEILNAKNKLKEINKKGILNYFESQRFGYANNSHIIGKYILQNKPELAVFEILTSCPKKPTEDIEKYTTFIKENKDEIIKQNNEILEEIKKIIPKFLESDLKIINHLYKYKNDFYGAFRTIPKKIRTLYINAYQSFLFNEILNNITTLPEELELFNSETKFENPEIQKLILNLLEKDNLKQKDFELKITPELKLKTAYRKTKIYPKNLVFNKKYNDELNENKFKILIEFDLNSGEYATNIIKQLFI